MYFAQVKTPGGIQGPWDYYKILATIPGDQAFRPMAEAGCPLVGALRSWPPKCSVMGWSADHTSNLEIALWRI